MIIKHERYKIFSEIYCPIMPAPLELFFGDGCRSVMGKFYFAFAWDIIVNLHVCICKNKICIWSDPGVNLPICKYTPVCICVRMRHLLTPSKICTPEYIYTCVFLAHANWT